MTNTINGTYHNDHDDWINQLTQELSLFLQSYINKPEESPLCIEQIIKIAKVIYSTTAHGTQDQQETLYLLLLGTRCILGKRGREALRTPIANLANFFKVLKPTIVDQVETAILNNAKMP